jgi:hypothetical protein
MSAAEGYFSSVTQEPEKNYLKRSGTKASLQRPGCGSEVKETHSWSAGEERATGYHE